MTEEETTTTIPEESTPPTDVVGGQSLDDKNLVSINRAVAAAERLELATKDLNKALRKQEALQVQSTLAGTASVTPPEMVEETPREYADRVMRGEGSKKS